MGVVASGKGHILHFITFTTFYSFSPNRMSYNLDENKKKRSSWFSELFNHSNECNQKKSNVDQINSLSIPHKF